MAGVEDSRHIRVTTVPQLTPIADSAANMATTPAFAAAHPPNAKRTLLNPICACSTKSLNRTTLYSSVIYTSTTSPAIPRINRDSCLCELARFRWFSRLIRCWRNCYPGLSTSKNESLTSCLLRIAVTGNEASFLEYSCEWVKLVSRGGLFEVNDAGYLLFRTIEISTRERLALILKLPATKENQKQIIISSVCLNVVSYWKQISDKLGSDCQSELLRELVDRWLTIRGFSLARQRMEFYKRFSKTNAPKNH